MDNQKIIVDRDLKSSGEKCLLSVVIIAKNEEKHIGKCIESVLEATKEIPHHEIILVDSASTDRTIKIAKEYPLKIIQIPPHYSLCCAAGRYIGFLHSNGQYVFFLDGDMTVDREWFKRGIPILENKNDIAGIGGLRPDCFSENNLNNVKDSSVEEFGEVEVLAGGGALFKQDVLEKVGCYNPYIRGEEDTEISCRIRDAGYKLLSIDMPMIYHWKKWSDIGTYTKRVRYFEGFGRTLRYSLRKKYFWWCVKRYRMHIIVTFWVLFNLGILAMVPLLILQNFTLPTYICVFIDAGIFGMIFSKKRALKLSVLSFIGFVLMGFYVIIGFLKSPKDPSTYPTTEVKIIKA